MQSLVFLFCGWITLSPDARKLTKTCEASLWFVIFSPEFQMTVSSTCDFSISGDKQLVRHEDNLCVSVHYVCADLLCVKTSAGKVMSCLKCHASVASLQVNPLFGTNRSMNCSLSCQSLCFVPGVTNRLDLDFTQEKNDSPTTSTV